MKLVLLAKLSKTKTVDKEALKLFKKLMKLDGYSQDEAGKLLGVSQKQISRYLAEEAEIPAGVLDKIKKALGEDK